MGSPTTCHVKRNLFFSYLFVFESDALGTSAGLISVLVIQPFLLSAFGFLENIFSVLLVFKVKRNRFSLLTFSSRL